MRYRIVIFIGINLLLCHVAQGRELGDSLQKTKDKLTGFEKNSSTVVATSSDTIKKTASDTTKTHTIKPIASRAVWMGAIVPGFGQIVNKKYWKLPLVYGALGGCGYAVWFNNTSFVKFKTAYNDASDADNSTNSHLKLIPPGFTEDDFGGKDAFINIIKAQQDYYRRYRDMSVMITVIVYAATLVDAYVDAQLFDFDISPNLTMHIQPSIIQSPTSKAYGLQCNFNFWR